MILKLYYDSTQLPLADPVNRGFDEAMKSWTALEKKKAINGKRIDTAGLSQEQLYMIYQAAVIPSVIKRFRVRQVFGSRKQSGHFFGRGVPALLVYEHEKENPVDVYPHEEVGRVITINEFLIRLTSA